MIVAIQQPEHAPWMGFFHKMAHCDRFVLLDSVQFKKRYFENRNRIRGASGPQWITVPVHSKGRYHQQIDEVRIDDARPWVRKYLGSLEQAYARASYGQDMQNLIRPCLEARHEYLVSLNLAIIETVRDYLAIATPTIRASEMGLGPLTGSELILAICAQLGATTYLSGPDGRNYLDHEAFAARGITVAYHDFKHPTYPQRGQGEFLSHLSILDLIANCGDETSRLVRGKHMAEILG